MHWKKKKRRAEFFFARSRQGSAARRPSTTSDGLYCTSDQHLKLVLLHSILRYSIVAVSERTARGGWRIIEEKNDSLCVFLTVSLPADVVCLRCAQASECWCTIVQATRMNNIWGYGRGWRGVRGERSGLKFVELPASREVVVSNGDDVKRKCKEGERRIEVKRREWSEKGRRKARKTNIWIAGVFAGCVIGFSNQNHVSP